MANFTPPVAEMGAISPPQLQSTNEFSNTVYGNPVVIEGTRKINHTCLLLNGTTDYIVITEPLLVGTTFTADLWVWFSSIGNAEQVILSQAVGSSAGDTSLSIKNQKLIIVNNSVETAGATTVTPKMWHHVALVRNGTTCKAFLDGILEATYESFVAPDRTQTQVGARLGTTLFSGMMDAVRFRTEASWSTTFSVPVRSDYIADEYFDDVSLLLRGDSFTSERDPYADKLAFQLGMDHYNNSVYMGPWDDTDVIGAAFAGNAKILSSHFKHNYPSISFDGVNDAIVIANTPQITLGTTFTLEFWMHLPDYAVRMTLLDKREAATLTGAYIYTDTDTKLYAKFGDSTAGWDVELTSGTLSTGWHHIAIVRNASDTNSWKLFVDGSQAGATVNSAITVAENANLLIGRNLSNAEYFHGQLSEIQLTQNTAKYTTSVTVPTAPVLDAINLEYEQTSLLLHFDGADSTYEFTDSSRWNHTVTGTLGAKISTTQSKFGSSSLYLSGSAGCGIQVRPHESLNIGEGDFTFELWARLDSVSSSRSLGGMWVQGNTYGPWLLLYFSSSNRIQVYWLQYSGGVLLQGSAVTIAANTWYHIAVTRRNDWWTLWTNGVIDAQAQLAPRNYRTGTKFRTDRGKSYGIALGDYFDGTKYGTTDADFVGYIDEVRLVKGKAMYTEPFTVPAAAFSLSTNYPYRDSNVKLFLDVNQDYQIRDKSISCNAITFEGGIIAGKVVGGSYASFDGNGDAIRYNTSMPGDVAFGYDDFTVEAWVYPINGGWVSQAWGRIIETEQAGTSGGFMMYMGNSGNTNPANVAFQDSKSSGSEFALTTVATLPNSTWSHVAFTRENGYIKAYLDGVLKNVTRAESPWNTDRIGAGYTLSNSNKTASSTLSNSWQSIVSVSYFNSQSSIGTYFEVVFTATHTANQQFVGVAAASFTPTGVYTGNTSDSWGYLGSTGQKYTNATGASYGATWTANNVIGVAVKNGKVWFSKNGVWQASGDPVTEANPAYSTLTGWVSAGATRYTGTTSHTIRTSVSEFTYAIPVGFVALRESGQVILHKTRVSIGANNSGTESFYGNIDDVRLTRGVARYGMTWAEKTLVGDTYASNVMLLLNCNGTDGGTTFTDSSNSNKTVTVNGTVTTVTATKRFETASAQFDGSTGYLSLSDSDDWNFGSGDFTIEMWYKFRVPPTTVYTGTSGQYVYSQYLDSNNYVIIAFGWSGIIFEVKNLSSTVVSTSNSTIHDSQWHHVAITRVNTTVTMWLDGASIGTASISGSMPNISAELQIGRLSSGSKYFNGWLDDIRITKGTGRYPAEFVYSSRPHTGLLPFKRRKIQDLPSNVTSPYSVRTLRGAGAKFDIAVDLTYPGINTTIESNCQWIIQPYNFSMVPGVTDFTIEGWFNPTVSASRWLMTKDVNAADGFLIGISSTHAHFRCPSTTDLTVSTLSLTGWNHVAWQRRGDFKQIFINGVKVAETTQSFDASAIDDTVYIGSITPILTGSRYIGYIDGFRFTRGVARYLANFTPPTTQFPSKFNVFPNTSLLTFFTDPPSLSNSVKLIGSPKTVRPSAILEKGACWFDGDDDYIQLMTGSVINSDDFTLECWFELHQHGTVAKPIHIWSQGNSLTQTDKVGIASVGPELKWVYGTTFTTLDTVPLYTWTHLALTRQSGLLKIFVNGVKKYEASVPVFGGGKSVLGLVSDETISASEYRFRGFISNFRILKDVVSYTGDFTPSTTLPTQAQSNLPALADPDNDLVVGDFLGKLDEVTIIDGAATDSMIQYIREEATMSPPATPRVITTNTGLSKSKNANNGQWFGLGKIWGTVTDAAGQPMSRKVVLIEYWSYMPVEEVVSDPVTGYYEFTDLDTTALFSVVAEDHRDYRFNDVIRAKVRAEVV
jgi:hypothetical protein